MRFERDFGNCRAFMEFERSGDRFVLKSRGFVQRFVPSAVSGMQQQPRQMAMLQQQQQATESPLIHDGSQNVLSTGFDFRNSTVTGSTLQGPNGSGQFLLVTFSTARTLQPFTSTMLNLSSAQAVYGVCQNKPRAGDAVDVGIFGVTKVVAGLTGITGGTLLQASSTASGTVTPFLGGNGNAVGLALETVTGVGQVFTAFIGGVQTKAAST